MYAPLATTKQIQYLQSLTDKAERIKQKHPSLIPLGLMYRKWTLDLTSEQVGLRIQMYNKILQNCYRILYPYLFKQIADSEDLPE